MGKARPGLMFYHDDIVLLKTLPEKQALAFFVAVLEYSQAVAEGRDVAQPRFPGKTAALWEVMLQHIRRAQEQYDATCQRNRQNRMRSPVVTSGAPPVPTETRTETRTGKETGTETGAETPPSAPPVTPAPAEISPAPTREEVAAFCRETGLNIDAGRFFDYYQARGWMLGNAPIRDWQAAARTWASRDAGFAPASAGKTVGEQRYTQRPYSHSEAAVDAMMAEYFAAQGGNS